MVKIATVPAWYAKSVFDEYFGQQNSVTLRRDYYCSDSGPDGFDAELKIEVLRMEQN